MLRIATMPSHGLRQPTPSDTIDTQVQIHIVYIYIDILHAVSYPKPIEAIHGHPWSPVVIQIYPGMPGMSMNVYGRPLLKAMHGHTQPDMATQCTHVLHCTSLFYADYCWSEVFKHVPNVSGRHRQSTHYPPWLSASHVHTHTRLMPIIANPRISTAIVCNPYIPIYAINCYHMYSYAISANTNRIRNTGIDKCRYIALSSDFMLDPRALDGEMLIDSGESCVREQRRTMTTAPVRVYDRYIQVLTGSTWFDMGIHGSTMLESHHWTIFKRCSPSIAYILRPVPTPLILGLKTLDSDCQRMRKNTLCEFHW